MLVLVRLEVSVRAEIRVRLLFIFYVHFVSTKLTARLLCVTVASQMVYE